MDTREAALAALGQVFALIAQDLRALITERATEGD
jgi:hypothetical protein